MEKLRDKNFLKKLVIYFGIVISIPACTIILMFQQTDKLLKEQIQVSSWNTLNQFFRAVDVAVEEAENIVTSIMSSEECKEYARRAVYAQDRTSYQAILVQEYLRQHALPRYKDIIVHFPYAEKIFSGINGSIDTSNYLRAYYTSKDNRMEEQLKSIINCENRYTRLFSIVNENGETNLCVAALVKKSNNQSFVVAVILSQEYLHNLLKDAEEIMHGELLIYGEEREQLYSTGNVQIELPEQQKKEITYETSNENTKYMVWSEASEVIAGYYAYAVPYAYYKEQMQPVRTIFIIGFLACMVLSVTIAYRLSNRAYVPIEEMMKIVRKSDVKGLGNTIRSEFEYASKIIAEEREEILKMKSQVKSSKKVVLEHMIRRCIRGEVSEQEGRNIFAQNNVEISSPYFLVAAAVSGETEDNHMLSLILENVFCELFEEHHKAYMVPLADKRYVFVVNLKENAEISDCIGKLEFGQKFLWEKMGIALFVGVGEVCEGVAHIADSYKEAIEALRYRYLYGNNYVLSYQQVKERQLNYQTTTESKLFMRFMSYITGCEEMMDAEGFVASLFSEHKIDDTASMGTVEVFRTRVVAVINSMLLSRGYLPDYEKEKMDSLIKAETLQAFSKKLAELLELIKEHESERKENDTAMWIKEYIENHYSDCGLSVQSIAACLDMSYVDASKCFREVYNVKITDYIAQVRIKNAKIFLESTKYTLNEIAEKCGFLDSPVFSKTFKKLEDITPGNYRKIVKGKNE